MDETSRVIYAVAQVVDPYAVLGRSSQAELRMGTFVRAEIQGVPVENVIVLPRSVVRRDDTVLVANSENKLEIRPVEVLRAEPEIVYISSGLEEGEQVISTVLDAPIPGTLLTVRDKPAGGKEMPVAEQRNAGNDDQP